MTDEPEVLDDHLYIALFADGVVKVGRSRNPEQRLKGHTYTARMRGTQRTAHWVSGAHGHTDVMEAEGLLKKFCAERWPVAFGMEYFAGADGDQVLKYAHDLEDVLWMFEGRPDHPLLAKPGSY